MNEDEEGSALGDRKESRVGIPPPGEGGGFVYHRAERALCAETGRKGHAKARAWGSFFGVFWCFLVFFGFFFFSVTCYSASAFFASEV